MPRVATRQVQPRGFELKRTYQELFYLLDAFAHGDLGLVVLVGPPGPGKSTAVASHLRDRAVLLTGGTTPYFLYKQLWQYRNQPIILDDSDKLFRSQDGVFLLKTLTQTAPTKTVQWNSSTGEITKGELPSSFTTTSRTIIIANSWPQDNADVQAIESRGHLIYFAPSPLEMHRYAGTWFKDEEVYEFIGLHIRDMDTPDLRLYYKALERKKAGERTGDTGEWQRFVLSHSMSGDKLVAWQLMNEDRYASDNDRAAQFNQATGKSGRTFYRWKEELKLRLEDRGATALSRQNVKAWAAQ